MKEDTKKRKKISDIIKDNLQKITIFAISIFYITQGLFSIKNKEATFFEIICNIFLSIIVGVVISTNLTTMGLKEGRKNERFLASEKHYGETKEQATKYFDKLSSWCDYKNHQELQQRKKEIIEIAGLSWKAYKFGYYKEHKDKINQEQINFIEQANNLKIDKINNRVLLVDVPNEIIKKNKFLGVFGGTESKFGESEREYKKRMTFSDLLSKVLTGMLLGAFGLMPLLTGDNYMEILANMFWNTIQIIIWLSFGVMKYENAKSFMENEYRQLHLIQKTEYLKEFIITMENNPEIVKEFSEDEEIDSFIEEFIKEREAQNETK